MTLTPIPPVLLQCHRPPNQPAPRCSTSRLILPPPPPSIHPVPPPSLSPSQSSPLSCTRAKTQPTNLLRAVPPTAVSCQLLCPASCPVLPAAPSCHPPCPVPLPVQTSYPSHPVPSRPPFPPPPPDQRRNVDAADLSPPLRNRQFLPHSFSPPAARSCPHNIPPPSPAALFYPLPHQGPPNPAALPTSMLSAAPSPTKPCHAHRPALPAAVSSNSQNICQSPSLHIHHS